MHADPSSSPDPLSRALEDVVTRFEGMVRSVGWRHRLSEGDIDEVMQQVRIRLWRARGDSEQIAGAPASYVYRTAVSAALDLMRRRRSHRADREVSIEDERREVSPRLAPDQELESAELVAHVSRAVETLAPNRRPVVRMYLAGYPREEIAALLGWSEAKTRNLLYRGLEDLRNRLRQQGIGWEVAQ